MTTPAPRPDPDRAPTAWARMGRLVVEYGVQWGVERDSLLRDAGLAPAALADPDGRIPLLALYDLLESGSSRLNDNCFGLHLAACIQVEDMDALGFLMITSPTFGGALERMFRYQRMWAEGERFTLVPDGSRVRVTYEQYGPARPAHVQMAQMSFCDFVINGGRLVPGLSFECVRFRHDEPAEAEEYRRMFPAPVEFGAGIDEVRFDKALLDHPMPDANAALCDFFDRYTRDKLERLPANTSVVARVRDRLRKQLPDGLVKLEHVAEHLHMSARTLQRRLSDEGTSLQAELEEVRRQQALYFLEAGVAIAELSWLLGYSDASVFHRAFKRWTNTSPEAWRSAHRRASA